MRKRPDSGAIAAYLDEYLQVRRDFDALVTAEDELEVAIIWLEARGSDRAHIQEFERELDRVGRQIEAVAPQLARAILNCLRMGFDPCEIRTSQFPLRPGVPYVRE